MKIPHVGMIVWYWPSSREIFGYGVSLPSVAATSVEDKTQNSQPLAAIVTYVHGKNMVNLSVFDRNGNQYRRSSVFLASDDSKPGEGQPYAEWMSVPTNSPDAVTDDCFTVSATGGSSVVGG